MALLALSTNPAAVVPSQTEKSGGASLLEPI